MFSDACALIAERKIREAIARGELDNLSLKGQPIPREDLGGVPEELRMGYKVLKNAGCLPRELELRRELLTLQDLLCACQDADERVTLRKRLTLVTLHYNLLSEKNLRNPAFRQYQGRLESRLGL